MKLRFETQKTMTGKDYTVYTLLDNGESVGILIVDNPYNCTLINKIITE